MQLGFALKIAAHKSIFPCCSSDAHESKKPAVSLIGRVFECPANKMESSKLELSVKVKVGPLARDAKGRELERS